MKCCNKYMFYLRPLYPVWYTCDIPGFDSLLLINQCICALHMTRVTVKYDNIQIKTTNRINVYSRFLISNIVFYITVIPLRVYIRFVTAWIFLWYTVYPKKYANGFVVLCFVVVMQSFIINYHEVFIHIHQVYFAGTGAIVRLPQCQWSKPDG